MSDGWSVLVKGGVVFPTNPGPTSAFLRSTTPGVYTTTRTIGGVSYMLLWERHLARLAESLQLQIAASPDLYISVRQDLDVKRLIQPSVKAGLTQALKQRIAGEEIALTILLCGDKTASACDVYVHASRYNAVEDGKMPLGTSVAIMGPGRTLARVKNSLWASTRQVLERARPAGTSEIILSNDGDSLLEGTLTNFFVVARRKHTTLNSNEDSISFGQHHSKNDWSDVEVQTAPLEDGVLPGVIRSLVIAVCKESGIPLHEVAPSWGMRHTWREAFVTSSLRVLQPVGKIQMPTIRTFELHPWNLEENSWEHLKMEVIFRPGSFFLRSVLRFQSAFLKECGAVTQKIHELVVERAKQESISITNIIER